VSEKECFWFCEVWYASCRIGTVGHERHRDNEELG